MKQRIRVVGLARREGGVLLLKRRQGRIETPARWELPTGKIDFGEQPEEAMTRTLLQYLGVRVSSVKLVDVITFTAFEGASQMSNLYIVYEVELEQEEKIELQERYTAYKYVKNTEIEAGKMNEASLAVLEIETGVQKSTYREVAHGASVFVDGASRGNPGPSGVGYCIMGENGEVLKQGGEFVGFATSRVAEYYAMKEGMKQAINLGLKNVRFVGDNLMMMNQLRGIYKVKNADLRVIYKDVQKLIEKFESCAFVHVVREENKVADMEANAAIDREFCQK